LIQVPNKWLLEFNLPRRWACSIPNYENLWQIRTATWRVKKVLVESSDLIAFNFNEGTYQWTHYNWWYYMGTILVWLTIVCSRKHALFPTSNKLTTKRRQLTLKLLNAWRWFLLTFNTDQRFYRSSKQPRSPWSKLCLVLRTWRAMVNQLSQYFVN
jgi:hypothetical protein